MYWVPDSARLTVGKRYWVVLPPAFSHERKRVVYVYHGHHQLPNGLSFHAFAPVRRDKTCRAQLAVNDLERGTHARGRFVVSGRMRRGAFVSFYPYSVDDGEAVDWGKYVEVGVNICPFA